MPSLLARAVGMSPDAPIPTDAAVVIVKRRSNLTPRLARVVVLDYKGLETHEVIADLKVTEDTLKCYWRRIYTRLNYKHHPDPREAVQAWVEGVLNRELESDAQRR